MNNYIEKVLNKHVLAEEIENMTNEGILNLIQTDWFNKLKNNGLYLKYKNDEITFAGKNQNYRHIVTQRVLSKEEYFKLLIVGRFVLNVDENSTFIAMDCPPLKEITNVFAEKNANYSLNDKAKFFVDACGGPVACKVCFDLTQEYNLNVDSRKEWWCMRRTKIYNGDAINLATTNEVYNAFGRGDFLGIFDLTVSSRQYFGPEFSKMKICGTVNDMILFKESVFDVYKPTTFRFIADVTSSYSSDSKNKMVVKEIENKPYKSTSITTSSNLNTPCKNEEVVKEKAAVMTSLRQLNEEGDSTIIEEDNTASFSFVQEYINKKPQKRNYKSDENDDDDYDNYDVIHSKQSKYDF